MNLPQHGVPLTGATPYETWVRTLRAFATDPSTSLGHLPQLDATTFTPETFNRLSSHLQKALDGAAQRWLDGVSRAIEHSSDPFQIQRALVNGREGLRPLLSLAGHPALPGPVRERTLDEVRKLVERVQRESEEQVRRRSETGRVPGPEAEHLLRMLRENAFTAVLREEPRPATPLPVAPQPAVAPAQPAAATVPTAAARDEQPRSWLSRFVKRVP